MSLKRSVQGWEALQQKINLVNVLIWLVNVTTPSRILAHGLARPSEPNYEIKVSDESLETERSSDTNLVHERRLVCGTCCPSFGISQISIWR